MVDLDSKLKILEGILKGMESAIVAFSGGVDSSFLLKVSKDVLGDNVLAVTAVSETYTNSELADAKKYAKLLRVRHKIIRTDELKNSRFLSNPTNRCYYCKKELFLKLRKIARENRISYVLDASNYDDLSDYRPGMMAAKEIRVRSPLKEAKLTKNEIRQLSKKLGLETWNKPSAACLASRFPYDSRITRQGLAVVGKAEGYLRKLGFRQLRVRHYGDTARIEIEQNDFRRAIKNSEKINSRLRKIGFKYITLDLGGYRTGSMNEGLRGYDGKRKINRNLREL